MKKSLAKSQRFFLFFSIKILRKKFFLKSSSFEKQSKIVFENKKWRIDAKYNFCRKDFLCT